MKSLHLHSFIYSVSAGLLLIGCAPLQYSEFTGKYKQWPTAAGTMVETTHAIPVYRGFPEKPYTVLGSIRFTDPNAYWDDGDTARAAHLGKERGGDAIIIRIGSEVGVGLMTGSGQDARLWGSGQVGALVIKWKSETALAAEKAMVERLEKQFKAQHQDLTPSKELVAFATEYSLSQGINLETEDGAKKWQETLAEISMQPKNSEVSKLLFKGTIRSSALTTSATDSIYGIATVSQKGENVTIVSNPGSVDLNFSGTISNGRLVGQIGLSASGTIVSAKAEGVIVGDRISLTSQAQTPEGTFQGSFTFCR